MVVSCPERYLKTKKTHRISDHSEWSSHALWRRTRTRAEWGARSQLEVNQITHQQSTPHLSSLGNTFKRRSIGGIICSPFREIGIMKYCDPTKMDKTHTSYPGHHQYIPAKHFFKIWVVFISDKSYSFLVYQNDLWVAPSINCHFSFFCRLPPHLTSQTCTQAHILFTSTQIYQGHML